jgi:hypothetical protein
MPTDSEGLRKYYAEANKQSHKVRYTGIKMKQNRELYNSVVEKLNLLSDEDFGSFSRRMILRLKALNEVLTEDYELETSDTEVVVVVTNSQEVLEGLANKPKIKLALK